MSPPRYPRGPIVQDLWGDEYRVVERRSTSYGFPLLMGRPYPPQPVQGGSGATGVILTPSLAAHLRTHARRPYALPLPVGRDAIRRARRRIGVDLPAWDDTRFGWWIDRIEDLAALSIPEFVARHGKKAWTRSGALSEGRVWQMRLALLGRQRRPPGWWNEPGARDILLSKSPTDVVAKRLGITPVRVEVLRRKLRAGASRNGALKKARR